MTEKEFSSFLYDLYRAWCRERDIDYRDDANKQAFLDEALPTEN